MAHLRKPLMAALALNTVVLAVELVGGIRANSLSLVMDGVHNVSDEAGLAFLALAYFLSTGLSSRFLRFANLFNSVGFVAISGVLIWEAVHRMLHPVPMLSLVAIVAGLIGAICNWGVARCLQGPSKEDAAIRLAYTHNLGDVLVSLVPVVSGILTLVTRRLLFDPLLALGIAAVIITGTIRAVIGSHQELLWPEHVVCGGARVQKSGART